MYLCSICERSVKPAQNFIPPRKIILKSKKQPEGATNKETSESEQNGDEESESAQNDAEENENI